MRSVSFRRRLVIAYVLVAAISAGALAVASFLLVRDARLTDSLHARASEARVDLDLAQDLAPNSQSLDPNGFVQSYERAGTGAHVVLDFPGRAPVASDPRVNPRIPASVTRLADAGQLGYARIAVGGRPFLVIGGRAPGSSARLYFLFSEEQIASDLAQLRNALAAAWLGVVALALLVGWLLARRTLDPVARASQAARQIAGGELGTRLPDTSRDEFGAWARSFNDMADALQTKIAALSMAQERERRFTSDVAHELRTPVTALVAEASVLAEQVAGLPAGARRPTELLIADVRRLRTLVDDLMEVSRLDAGSEPVVAGHVELREFVATVLRVRGWDGQVALAGEPVTITADPRRLERIIGNLVGNAIEHGRHDVRVRITSDAGVACVDVADEGQGIAAADVPHVFERFYKADSARTGPGSGLGLAIALENARLLGGDISLSTEVGRGSTFRLVLPLHPDQRTVSEL
jgi:two-component system sensor histidine kinase MtrB